MDLNIPAYVWILLSICFLSVIIAAFTGLKNMRAFARCGARMVRTQLPEQDDSKLPGVSVIVYAKNAEENIKAYLRDLLDQDYPEFEVIVVNDASIDNTAEIVETMQQSEPRLRSSFVPDSSRNVSRRKVAFTIGAKAARFPVLLITVANLSLPSSQWLRRMVSSFESGETELSLGTALFPRNQQRGAGRWYRQFDSLSVLSQWLGSAMRGKPYRGDSCALAFRKDTFFNNRGYAASNRFVAGEDDIFVNAIARPGNTAVVFHPDAVAELILPASEYPRLWMRSKERYTFTARYLDTWALRMQAMLSLCQWLSLLSAIVASLVALPNLLPTIMASAMIVFLWAYEICLYRRAAKLTATVKLFWSVPFFWLMRPIVNAWLRLPFRADKAYNYTWQHPS